MTPVTTIELAKGWKPAPATAEGKQVSVRHFDTLGACLSSLSDLTRGHVIDS